MSSASLEVFGRILVIGLITFCIAIPSAVALVDRPLISISMTAPVLWSMIGYCILSVIALYITALPRLRMAGFVGVLIALLVLSFLIQTYVDAPLVSDFKIYWSLAGDRCEAESWSVPRDIYEQRASGLLAAIRCTIGADAWVYRTVNAALYFASAFLVYTISAPLLGVQLARVAAVVPLLSPEVALAGGIANHDPVGMALLLLIVWLTAKTLKALEQENTLGTGPLLAVLASIAVIALSLQRFPFSLVLVFAIGPILLAVLASPSRQNVKNRLLPLLSVSPFILLSLFQGPINAVTGHDNFNMPGMHRDTLPPILKLTSHSYADGTHGYSTLVKALVGDIHFRDPRQLARLDSLARTLLVTDVLEQVPNRLNTLRPRSARLFDLGSLASFYMNNDFKERSTVYHAFKLANWLYTTLLLAAVCSASITLLFARRSPLDSPDLAARYGFVAAVFIPSVLSMLFMLTSSLQSRYMFPLYFFAPIIVFSVGRLALTKASEHPGPSAVGHFSRRAALLGAVSLLGALAIWGAAKSLEQKTGRVLKFPSDGPERANLVEVADTRDKEARNGLFGPYDALIRAGPIASTVSWRWCGYSPRQAYSFEILTVPSFTGAMPLPSSSGARGVELDLVISGHKLESLDGEPLGHTPAIAQVTGEIAQPDGCFTLGASARGEGNYLLALPRVTPIASVP